MKRYLFGLFLLLISIEFIQSKSKKTVRSYVMQRDGPMRQNKLTNYTIFDKTEKQILYRIKCSSTDFDTMLVIRYPQRDVIANAEGIWIEEPFNTTFSLYDQKAHDWTDGIVQKKYMYFNYALTVPWDGKQLILRNKVFSTRIVFYYKNNGNQIIARGKRRVIWFNNPKTKQDIHIFDDTIPEALTFCLFAMLDQRFTLD